MHRACEIRTVLGSVGYQRGELLDVTEVGISKRQGALNAYQFFMLG